MSKVKKIINYRIVVEPDLSFTSYPDKKCEEIKAEIKRHVDNVASVHVEWDTEVTCSHCGNEWEEEKETGEPLCCNKAVEEWEQSKQQSPSH